MLDIQVKQGGGMIHQMRETDEAFMNKVFKLARRGEGTTSPNPRVGAVLVKNYRVVAEGFHRRSGEAHAEAVVLKKAGSQAKGSILYINLEPCCHDNKKTPPCAQEIIRAGVKRVVVASRDPNPLVNGKGLRLLKKHGIGISVGLFFNQEIKLNESYRKWITTGLPFTICKAGMTLDGKITPPGKSSGWITGSLARRSGHLLRNEVDAILVGVNTVINDNPLLTYRVKKKKNNHLLRVVVDSRLRIPLNSRVLQKGSTPPPLIITTAKASVNKIRDLEENGVQIGIVRGRGGHVDLRAAFKFLGRKGIVSLLIEGGGQVNRSAFRAGLVDKVVWYVSPVLSNDPAGVNVLGRDPSGSRKNIAFGLENVSLSVIGRDFKLEAYIR